MQLVDSDYLLVLDSNFRELNRLAHRIDQMDDYQREVFTTWVSAHDLCDVNDALRASYHLDRIEFHPGFGCDKLLGEFALESEMFEEYNSLPDEIYEALDKANAGTRMREMQGGVFAEGGYLVSEAMDGLDYPQEDPLPLFEMVDSDEAGMACYRSSWAQLNPLITEVSPEGLPALHSLKLALSRMDDEQALKCKALFEVAKPESIDEARTMADSLDDYDIHLQYSDPAAYAKDFLAQEFGMNQNDPTMRYIDLATLGKDELRAAGYEQTRYGAVYMGDPELELVQAEDQGFGGMTMQQV
jgi:hypothetical protein